MAVEWDSRVKVVGMARAIRLESGGLMPQAIEADRLLLRKFLSKMADLETAFLIEMKTVPKPRTFRQINTVWGLNKILFQCLNGGRSPSQNEAHDLYLDVLESYGDRVEVCFKPHKDDAPKTRPIHLSEADTLAASKIIQGYIEELAAYDLNPDQQGDVKKIFFDWMVWRGVQPVDPIDSLSSTEREFRVRNTVCMACTRGGEGLQLAHIVSRGANGKVRDEPWNWLILCHTDHLALQHQKGWSEFLTRYPHLKGRVERARKMVEEGEK